MHTSDANLPISRVDVGIAVFVNLLSGCVGSLTGDNKTIGLLFTTLANLWAIMTCALTLHEFTQRPADIDMTHLDFFLVDLLVFTTITSLLFLCFFTFRHNDVAVGCSCLLSLIAMVTVYVLGLIHLVRAHDNDCSKPYLKGSTFCSYSRKYVVWVVAGAGTVGPVWALIVIACAEKWSKKMATDEYDKYEAQVKDSSHHMVTIANNILSALCKVVLLGIYWWLFNHDLTWDFSIGGFNASLWVTGQVAKQGATVANTLLNCFWRREVTSSSPLHTPTNA